MLIEVFKQSSIKLSGKYKIYFDPYKIDYEYHDADYIFITHDHYDHFDIESINKIIKENTYIIVPQVLKDIKFKNVFVVDVNKEYKLNDITFTTTYAYNKNKKFHPKDSNYVGYNILIDNTLYYIMGDTDVVDEITKINTDICFIPIGGTYTMDVYEAKDYINTIKPKKVIPIHYGSIVGDINLGNKFKSMINKDIEVEIHIGG